jgi:hypothetical protein
MKVAVIATAVALTIAGAAQAARISSSPWVFGLKDPAKAQRVLVSTLRAKFGSASTERVRCLGMYRGVHAGKPGWHEIHCSVKVVLLGTVRFRENAVYYIDRHRKTQVREHVITS